MMMKLKKRQLLKGGEIMKQQYTVVGKISDISVEDLIVQKGNAFKIDKKKLKMVVTTALSLAIMATLQDVTFAAELPGLQDAVLANAVYKQPTQLQHIFEFVQWLIQLLRLIVSSVAGLICTFAGYKWATAIESNGQESAKKILKNAFVGGLIVWTGTTIADFFVGKMNAILLG